MKKYVPLFILFGAVGLMQTGYWWAVTAAIEGVSDRGLFGDMFGGFTALASGLAFAGMIYAIVLQSKELALQRKELRMTRQEMELARGEYARAAEAQQELVEKQMLTARIQGMATLTQGRYQIAAARGENASAFLEPAKAAEALLVGMMVEAGAEGLDLLEIR